MSNSIIVLGKSIENVNDLLNALNQEDISLKIKKRVIPHDNIEEQNLVSKLQNDLQRKISSLRTNRLCSRSQLKYDPKTEVIEILRQIGKSRFRSNGELNFCKILFYLEMNHVEIYYKKLPLSLEEAYCLILNEQKHGIFKKYIIISMLTRCGLTIRQFNENYDYIDEQSYIWQNLIENLKLNKRSAVNCFEQNKMEEIRKDFNSIKEKTIYSENIQGSDNNSNEVSNKRKVSFKESSKDKGVCKKAKVENIDKETSERIESIFKSIKIEKVNTNIENITNLNNVISPDFDLYLLEEKDKGNGNPNFRVLIISEEFPKIADLYKYNWRQKLKLPLILINVEDTRNIQMFILHIS